MKEDKLINIITNACPTICFMLLVSVSCLFFVSGIDTSLMQVKGEHVFGATYMTMNNPYYQLLDDQIRTLIEANGDRLISRDASMDPDKQLDQLRELIDAGVEVLFLTPVEWDNLRPALEEAYVAGVPVIVVDTPVKDRDLVSCSTLLRRAESRESGDSLIRSADMRVSMSSGRESLTVRSKMP